MTWYVENAEEIASAGLILLGVMGVFVSLIYNITRRKQRWVWAAGFVVIAVVAWHAEKTASQKQENKLTGGNNFAFLSIRPPETNTGPHFLRITNNGTGPIYQVSIGFHRLAADGTQLSEEWTPPYPIVYVVTANISASIAVGNYRFDFKARNGDWQEFLKLSEADGFLKEKIEVRRDGKSIYSTTNEYMIPQGGPD